MVTGHYAGFGTAFSIEERDGELLIVNQDIPKGFEPRLVAHGNRWRIDGGPFHGVEAAVDGSALVLADLFRLERLDVAPPLDPGRGLTAPEPSPGFAADCAAVWETARGLEGGVLDLGGLPAHEFVQWLIARDEIIFHGSNKVDIDEFLPRRTSMELHDVGGRGNLGAVYGTHDGLWSMFFAVVDRSALRGSIRNGVDHYENEAGERRDVYHFSVSSVSLPERPFTEGALYFLPRETFRRIPFFPGGPPSPEWASHEAVRPIARVLLQPEDFPFLDAIGGHDDGPLLELEDLTAEVVGTATSAERVEGGFRITTPAGRDRVERWAELGRRFLPDIERSLEAEGDATVITMTGPPAVLHVLEGLLDDLL